MDFKSLLENCLGRAVLDYQVRGGEVTAVLDNYQKIRLSVEDVEALDVGTAALVKGGEGGGDFVEIDVQIYSTPRKFRRDELRAAAAAVGVPGAWQMTKGDLVAVLEERGAGKK